MFYAIPLEDRPRWSNPPWMTLLIILVNVLVFFGPQRSEERAQQAAAQFYAASALPGIELPRFVDWLQRTDSPIAKQAKVLQKKGLRSEEHTSELQSPCNLVCRLLLEKKKEDV